MLLNTYQDSKVEFVPVIMIFSLIQNDHPNPKKRRLSLVDTCKLNCKAKIEMKETYVFPDVPISNLDIKTIAIMGNLRRQIAAGTNPTPQHRIYIRLPRAVVHIGHSMDPVKTYSYSFYF